MNNESMIKQHLSNIPPQLTEMLQRTFQKDCVVQLDHLLPLDLRKSMFEEAITLRNRTAVRRDLELAATGKTPRIYDCVGRDVIKEHGTIIPSFFHSLSVKRYLSQVVGEEVHCIPYAPEEYIINSQNKPADTHGWHFDDYTFALIWMVEAPGPFDGGRIEYVPNIVWDKNAPREQLESVLTERPVQSIYVPAGSCYLMRAQTTLHRVTPLLQETQRTVIVFSYASTADLTDDSITHETVEEIYTDEHFAVPAE